MRVTKNLPSSRRLEIFTMSRLLASALCLIVTGACNAGAWRVVAPPINAARFATVTLLQDGRALRTGGFSDECNCAIAKAEIFDPANGRWSAVGDMRQARHYHAAVLLNSGEVLVTGGLIGTSPSDATTVTEIFDPATMRWRQVSNSPLARAQHTLSLLPNGHVLAVGSAAAGVRSTELYDPATGLWRSAGLIGQQRVTHTATSLPNGDVLTVGGETQGSATNVVELYSAKSQTWRTLAPLKQGRRTHAAVVSDDGTVLVTGGTSNMYISDSAELYDPTTTTWADVPSLRSARAGHRMVKLLAVNGGKFLVAGGGVGVQSVTVGGDQWVSESPLNRTENVDNLLALSNGTALAVGYGTTEIYDPNTSQPPLNVDGEFGLAGLSAIKFDAASVGSTARPSIHPQTHAVLSVLGCRTTSVGLCAAMVDGNGQAIQAFGNAGMTDILPLTVRSTSFQSDGRILLAGSCRVGAQNHNWCIARLLASGQIDNTYGNAGIAHADGVRIATLANVLTLPDGGAVLVGNCDGASPSATTLCSAKFTAQGTLDAGYSRAIITPPAPNFGLSPYEVVISADGGYVVSAICAATHPNPAYVVAAAAPCIIKLRSNGTLDANFGANGFAVSNFANGHGTLSALNSNIRTKMSQAADGTIAVAFRCSQDFYDALDDCIAKWRADGQPMSDFGVNGVLKLAGSAGCAQNEMTVMTGYPDGRLVLLFACTGALGVDFSGHPDGSFRRVALLQANGTPDTQAFGLIGNSGAQFTTDIFVRSDGLLTAFAGAYSVRLIGVPTPAKSTPVIEYRYAPLDYYFSTARTAEQQLLDATPGWSRTGETFSVYAQLAENTSPLTRFYFDGVALTGKRGSHFYTTLRSENGVVQALNPLNEPQPRKPLNEGTAGFAVNVASTGNCPANTTPVYRAFRGNAKFPDDPNHRFTTKLDLYNALVSRGWDGEGVKFCALLAN